MPHVDDNSSDQPAPAAVRAALERVLASEPFRGSPQLATFLRFVVEAVLRGEESRIKGYTIAVEAFGRGDTFDPQIDPIVRVEGTRLRRALERYYAGPGRDDPIVLELPRGSYVPVIRRRSRGDATAWRVSPRARLTALVGAGALVVVIAAIVLLWRDGGREGRGTTAADLASRGQSFDGPLRPGNGMPTLLIPDVALLGLADPPGGLRSQVGSAIPLTEKLRVAFSRFDTLNVARGPADTRSRVQPEYQLVGSGEIQGDRSISGRFRLLDNRDGTIIWSQTFGPYPTAREYGATEDAIVAKLTMTLAPPFGVIRAHERVRHLATGDGDPRYRCIVEASESFRTFNPAQHTRARACLEALTARDPGFAMGFAYLAAIYVREFQYALGGSDDPSLLDRALRAARQGIELAPESARAYQLLFTALFVRRDIAAAFAAGDKALALNPHDMTILSDYGGRLIMIGELDRGMDALKRAADDGAVRPSWYHFYLFLGSYLKDDMATAARHAGLIATDTYPLGLVAAALAAASNADRERTRAMLDRLVALQPAWRSNPAKELAKFIPAAGIVERLARDLMAAGLDGAH